MAISVAGDNISNANTIGFKANRAAFEDIMAGEGVLGRQVGSGSQIGAVQTIFEQGTLEFTGRPLDLGISGNGFFVLSDGFNRTYTRAGDFKIDSAGFITSQDGLAVLGFPANGSGALEPINTNNIEQSSIATNEVNISGNVNSAATTVAVAAIPIPGPAIPPVLTYADLNGFAEYSTVVDVYDSLGESHSVSLMFFHTGNNEYTVRSYVNNEEVDPTASLTVTGYPRFVGEKVLTFGGNGQRSPAFVTGTPANFSNPEGLLRLGKNQLGVSVASGDAILGKADSGTFGTIKAGNVELSTVDIASEFVRIITLQRGFQASTRIITTINQLLNDVIQLA